MKKLPRGVGTAKDNMGEGKDAYRRDRHWDERINNGYARINVPRNTGEGGYKR